MESDRKNRIIRSVSIIALICILVLSAGLFIYLNTVTATNMKETTRQELEGLAFSISQHVDGDTLSRLQSGDEGTPEFLQLRDTLHLIKESNPQILYLYTMRQNGTVAEFVVDEAYGYEADAAYIGDVYTEVNPDLLAGFTRVSADHDFTTDQWGTVLSGYAPVYDSAGNAVGLVGVDMDSTNVQQEMFTLNWLIFTIGFAAMIFTTLIAIGSSILRSRSENQVEQANRKLHLLNSITRHDILNTLTGLLGLEDMALYSTTDKGVVPHLDEMRNLTKRVESQINFTRDYQNLGTVEPVWQNLREILQRAIFTIDLGDVNLSVDCRELEIYADQLLERVFYNLIDNALRYGGHVRHIRIRCEPVQKMLVLTVEDDGVGVPDGFKEDIFTRKHYNHTGFGLFLSKEILSITGITIRETGTYGEGARFEISIPRGRHRLL
ncbi:MAG TPA: ATP-binding protein [Methanomicrobiales archaeon]|nr:ATP-binding protein [Methanomicrobiales archaeon]